VTEQEKEQAQEAVPVASGREPLLVAEGLRKSFGRREVVRGVSLSVAPGETVGLLGRNGAGKTTTFRMIMGMLRPDGGRVHLEGKDIARLPVWRRARLGLGYLAQEPTVFQGLTVEDNIRAVLEIVEGSRAKRRKRLEELIEELGLATVRKNLGARLSGGERRRVEIARSLVPEPKVLLFDEPFSGVDPIAVTELRDAIAGLAARGIGILLTDHNVRETIRTTDRAAIIDEGRILFEGDSAELVNDPLVRRHYLGEQFAEELRVEAEALRRRGDPAESGQRDEDRS